jgi:uncharacterized membrane protein YczE
MWGLFLYSVGIIFTLNANIGYPPWDVFHVGFAQSAGISIGTASIITGVAVGIITIIMGEKLGIGTILNMVLIGVFLDIILALGIIPIAGNFAIGLSMMIIGMIIVSFASYYYIGSAFGAGPRDSLMVAITRKTGLPVGVCRGAIEVTMGFAGWKLGGMFGVGTIIAAFAVGFFIQTTFKLLKFDPTKVEHETLNQTFSRLRNKTEEPLSKENFKA